MRKHYGRNVLSLFVARLEEARLKIVDIVSVCAGLAVRQGALVALRRLPCARGRVSCILFVS